jgi:hypothetical protein
LLAKPRYPTGSTFAFLVPKHIAKIYRKNACQEVFGEPPGFVHAFLGLSDFILLTINDLIFEWTKFCRYDFGEMGIKSGEKR